MNPYESPRSSGAAQPPLNGTPAGMLARVGQALFWMGAGLGMVTFTPDRLWLWLLITSALGCGVFGASRRYRVAAMGGFFVCMAAALLPFQRRGQDDVTGQVRGER